MGNSGSRTASNNNQLEKEPSAKSSSVPSSPSSLSLQAGLGIEPSVGASPHPTQIRRSFSLDDVFERLNKSVRRISSSLSCTSLSSAGVYRRRFADQPNSRPWSRYSRKRWHEATLASDRHLSKTCWPVTHVEALFLPQFPVDWHAEKNYKLVEHIAKGSFGNVCRVRKAATLNAQEDYALKVFNKAEIIDNNAIRQLKDEVDIQSICGHHPFLSKCVRYWQTRKKVFLLSNHYPNGELFQKFSNFSADLVRLYVAEIALALDFLHQAGIIYRDLKSENVLLDQEFHVRLIDFGLSKWLSIGSRTRTICGTLQYMGNALFPFLVASYSC